MKESIIEKHTQKYAKDRGVASRKYTSPSKRSVPDRIFFFPMGRIVFIEMKAEGKHATPAQRREIVLLRSWGQEACVANSKQLGQCIVDSVLEEIANATKK